MDFGNEYYVYILYNWRVEMCIVVFTCKYMDKGI